MENQDIHEIQERNIATFVMSFVQQSLSFACYIDEI